MRKIFRVVPNMSQWQVKHDGTVLSNHLNKDLAIEAGRRAAQANQPSQLVMHKADGTIENEWTYGQDPFPPRG
jgi:hypothetical protein